MNKSLIYIVGGTFLVGGAYLFLKNKKAKDLSKLSELGGTTTGGATTGGTTSSGTTLGDGVAPSDANVNLANATVLATERKELYKKTKVSLVGHLLLPQLVELDKKLATLGYKVDATGTLVKI